jgi:uncharacterized protein YecE (DUF72 family)
MPRNTMSHQLDLFGFGPDESPVERVLPCADAPSTLVLASQLPQGLRLGTSSWSFPGWSGILYAGDPDQETLSRFGLGPYSAHPWLRTVGIDSTFYALPNVTRLGHYAAQVPGDFRFLVKAPAVLTDPLVRGPGGRPAGPNPSFLDPGLAVDQVIAPVLEGLGHRAGVILFQVPPAGRQIREGPRRFAEDLYRFLRRLPTGPTYAVELRDADLLTRDLVEALRHGGAQPAFSVHPRLPGLEEQRRLFQDRPPGPLIVRWMLRTNRGYAEARSLYRPFNRLCEADPENRRWIAELTTQTLGAGQPVFVIVNNKAEGSAPLSLLALAEAILARVEPATGCFQNPRDGAQ